MNEFTIYKNEYLKQDIRAFYNTDYLGHKKPNNPDYLNILKNDFNTRTKHILIENMDKINTFLFNDIDTIFNKIHQSENYKICIIPRSKAHIDITKQYFKHAVQYAISELDIEYGMLTSENTFDGLDYIVRHTNTYTTHMGHTRRNYTYNYNNDGPTPYPGITNDTCHISPNVKGKNILLIDDIYTKGVNIDEDAIQALLDNGAKSVVFYAVAKTVNVQTQQSMLEDNSWVETHEQFRLNVEKLEEKFIEKEYEKQEELDRQEEEYNEWLHEQDVAEWLKQDEMGAWGREKNRDR